MNVDDFRNLVEQANQSVVETGQLPKGWWPLYKSAISEVAGSYDGGFWPKQLFVACHYASTHLGLRYMAWRSTADSANEKTESVLSQVQLETELFFWRSACDAPCWQSDPQVTTAERTFIELCFGEASPLGENSSGASWKQSYEDCLNKMQESKFSSSDWSKWFCVAIHFSAFYLDLYQQRDVELLSSEASDDRTSKIDETIGMLSHKINNERVAGLISLWLRSATTNRDSSGLPKVGDTRPKDWETVSVRTLSELFLQVNIQPVSA